MSGPTTLLMRARMAAASIAAAASLLVVALATIVIAAGAQDPAPAGGAPPPAPSGILFGTIQNELNTAVAGAEVSVAGTALLVRSDLAGRFMLEGVPPGLRQLVVQADGYLTARAQLTVMADSALELSITLVSTGQRLPGVIVSGGISNRLVGVVVDDRDRPIAGAAVELVGLRRLIETDEEGRFVFLDVAPGDWLLQVRKKGYGVQQRGVRMLATLERDLAIRLRRGENPRMSTELAVAVAAEATSRQSLRGGRSVVISRDALEPWENASLGVALLGSHAGLALREAGSACVLVDGHEVLRSSAGGGGLAPRRAMGRGPTSIPGGGGQAGPGGSGPIGGRQAPMIGGATATAGNWLSFFRASDVEMVEIFPEGSDNSRTLCGRFPPSTGCSCPPEPAGIVIWLKK